MSIRCPSYNAGVTPASISRSVYCKSGASGVSFYVNPAVGYFYPNLSETGYPIPFIYYQSGRSSATKSNACSAGFTPAVDMAFAPSGEMGDNPDYVRLAHHIPDVSAGEYRGVRMNVIDSVLIEVVSTKNWTAQGQIQALVCPHWNSRYHTWDDVPSRDSELVLNRWGRVWYGTEEDKMTFLLTHPSPEHNVPIYRTQAVGVYGDKTTYWWPYLGGVDEDYDSYVESADQLEFFPFVFMFRFQRFTTGTSNNNRNDFNVKVTINFSVQPQVMKDGHYTDPQEPFDPTELKMFNRKALDLYQRNPFISEIGNSGITKEMMEQRIIGWIKEILALDQFALRSLFGNERNSVLTFVTKLLTRVKEQEYV